MSSQHRRRPLSIRFLAWGLGLLVCGIAIASFGQEPPVHQMPSTVSFDHRSLIPIGIGGFIGFVGLVTLVSGVGFGISEAIDWLFSNRRK